MIFRNHQFTVLLEFLSSMKLPQRTETGNGCGVMSGVTNNGFWNGKETVKNFVIPYYAPLTGRLQNSLKSQSLIVCYQSRGNQKEIIGKVKKGRKRLEMSEIHRNKCKRCPKWYYGQTKRNKVDREKEHDRAVRKKQPNKSAVAVRCLETGHERGPCEIVKKFNKNWELDARESLYIQNSDENSLMNTGEPPIRSKLLKFARFGKW